ncbi:MAG: TetR/AcrR family transcriptional regulator [Treponema sp.]|nr:TetR/AcrR family transcriptional regulator [Treponema sp.]
MPRQENTKEKILECAFGLFKQPRMAEISLSEIAAQAGISKTAIFRHYKNKEDLMEKMREKFFEAFSLMISQLDDSRKPYNQKGVEKAVRCIFDFCDRYPNYLSYFLQESYSDEILNEGVNLVFLDNGINIVHKDVFRDKNNYLPQNMVPSFFQQTLLVFLILAYSSRELLIKINDIEQYKVKVSELIYSGLGKKKSPLSETRKKELDKICQVQPESDEKSNRFFNAFVELIQKNKSSRITVEKIAAALGMAKSSIYSFFANKNDYLINMLFQEMERLTSILKEKMSAAANLDEALYIMIRTQASYFAQRPQVIMLHGYFNVQMGALSAKDLAELDKRTLEFFNKRSFDKVAPKAFDFPVSNSAALFVKWVSTLTVGFMLMGTRYDFPAEWLDFYVSTVYEMIECGIKYIKTEDGEKE